MGKIKPLLLFVIVMAAISLCAGSALALSDKSEIDIGRRADSRIKRTYGGEFKNYQIQRYVEEVGGKIVAVCERQNIPYHFTILDSDKINAMTLPGGYIYVSRGMLEALDSEAQLAAVLGHEITHVALRHGAERIESDTGFNLLLGIVGMIAARKGSEKTVKTTRSILRATSIAYDLAALGHGRKKELEADKGGTYYLFRAGYDPEATIEVLDIVQMEERKHPHLTIDFLRSHPKTTERIDYVREILQGLRESPKYDIIEGNFYPDRYRENVLNLLESQKKQKKEPESFFFKKRGF